MTSTAPHTQVDLLGIAPDAFRAAAIAASRQLPASGTVVAEEPVSGVAAADVLGAPDAQALTVDVTGAASGTVTLVVAGAVAGALQDGPLGAADLTAALTVPLSDAVAELEVHLAGPLQVGVARVVEAQAVHFGAGAVSVSLTDGTTTVAALVVELVTAGSALPDEASAPEAAAFTPLLDDGPGMQADRSMELLHDVEMAVTVELGRTRMAVAELLSLAPGAVVELDRAAGSPVDVLVNGKLIARGEVVVVDEDFAIRISEIVAPQRNRP